MRTLLAAAFLASGSAVSHAQDDVWKASSNTATVVTGDITLETDRVVFANGESIRLVPFEGRRGVFKVDPPANPMLMNGNRLCSDDVTCLVLAQREEDSLFMKVFDGPEAPLEAVADPKPQREPARHTISRAKAAQPASATFPARAWILAGLSEF
jgi:glycine/D-amino acid oxidase-like deaminating enzyme